MNQSLPQYTSDFLRTRRSRLTPAEVGLPPDPSPRRVPGLRREEVARLASISVDYYVRIERGNIAGVSPDVLDSLSRALRLTEVEREYLFSLARAAQDTRAAAGPEPATVRPAVVELLREIATPAFLCDPTMTILSANASGQAVLRPLMDSPQAQGNIPRYIFLDPQARGFFREYATVCADNAAHLRMAAARFPRNTALTQLIADLLDGSDLFRRHWAMQEVNAHHSGDKLLHHPRAGDLDFHYEVLHFPGEETTLNVYTAGRGSATDLALRRLSNAP